MTDEERAAIKALFPEHAFMMIVHPLGSAVIAIPKQQSSPEKEAACELWHGSVVKLGIHEGDKRV